MSNNDSDESLAGVNANAQLKRVFTHVRNDEAGRRLKQVERHSCDLHRMSLAVAVW